VGYFGPGELPVFDAKFFDIPKGTRENAALNDLLKVIESEGPAPTTEQSDAALGSFRDRLRKIVHGEAVSDSTMF
jgi:hypothetical protein